MSLRLKFETTRVMVISQFYFFGEKNKPIYKVSKIAEHDPLRWHLPISKPLGKVKSNQTSQIAEESVPFVGTSDGRGMRGIAISPSNHCYLQTQNTLPSQTKRTVNLNLNINPSNGRHPLLSFAIDPSKTQTPPILSTTSSPPLVVFGSANADIYVEIDRLPKEGETISANTGQTLAGGKGANQAACGGKLSYPTYFVGQVGEDAHGKLIAEALENGGVCLDFLNTVPAAPTGHAVVMLQPDGQNSIIIVGGANMNCWPDTLSEEDLDVVRNAGIVLLQREIPDSVNIQVAKVRTLN